MSTSMIYLAVPLKHPDPAVVQFRIRTANRTASRLHDAGVPVFSPASHSEAFIDLCGVSQPWEYWAQIDLPILVNCCSVLAVLGLAGWQTSVGVQAEIEAADAAGIKRVMLDRCQCGRMLNDPVCICRVRRLVDLSALGVPAL